jgi:Spy/CpxP family protein refolding chaperone
VRWAAVSPRWRAVLALVMVFAAGLAGGAALEDIVDDIDRPLFAAGDDDDDDDVSEETILANLDLSPEQRASIERMFETREDRLEAYWDRQLPDLEALIDSSRSEIRGILTPEQRTTYDSQLTRLRVHLRRELREDHDD